MSVSFFFCFFLTDPSAQQIIGVCVCVTKAWLRAGEDTILLSASFPLVTRDVKESKEEKKVERAVT